MMTNLSVPVSTGIDECLLFRAHNSQASREVPPGRYVRLIDSSNFLKFSEENEERRRSKINTGPPYGTNPTRHPARVPGGGTRYQCQVHCKPGSTPPLPAGTRFVVVAV